ncbi:hypothetical protein [Kitasatospora sp. NPDC093102]|uniref:hypothetical protein n=1 Tax=Kitasatospora sp. NPDC093102 TaxID=3155069 RepID=UPI003425B420
MKLDEVRVVAAGKAVLSPDVTRRLIDDVTRHRAAQLPVPGATDRRLMPLT